MTARRLDVYLDGVFAGRLEQTTAGDIAFDYDERYRSAVDPTPLSLSMPLSAVHHRKRVVLPWLQGLLPDGDAALQAMSRRFGVSPRNPFALLARVGADAAGAVQIVPEGTPASDAGAQGDVRAVDDAEVAAMLEAAVVGYTDGVEVAGALGRFSLAGAQPKIALHRLDGAWGVPVDATPTTHILKPVVGPLARLDIVEQLTLGAARELGNDVSAAELVDIGRWHVLVSERYDRRRGRARWHRLHQEDLCQALAVPPQKKYQHRDGGPGVAAVGALLASLPYATDRVAAGRAFFRAFVFNVVAGCTDAHAKNYSLMLDGRGVALAPLYDLLTYAGYWDRSTRLNSAMSVDGEYALDHISATALGSVGARFAVVRDDAAEIVDSTRRGMLAAFEHARDGLRGVDAAGRRFADTVVDGVRALPLVIG